MESHSQNEALLCGGWVFDFHLCIPKLQHMNSLHHFVALRAQQSGFPPGDGSHRTLHGLKHLQPSTLQIPCSRRHVRLFRVIGSVLFRSLVQKHSSRTRLLSQGFFKSFFKTFLVAGHTAMIPKKLANLFMKIIGCSLSFSGKKSVNIF